MWTTSIQYIFFALYEDQLLLQIFCSMNFYGQLCPSVHLTITSLTSTSPLCFITIALFYGHLCCGLNFYGKTSCQRCIVLWNPQSHGSVRLLPSPTLQNWTVPSCYRQIFICPSGKEPLNTSAVKMSLVPSPKRTRLFPPAVDGFFVCRGPDQIDQYDIINQNTQFINIFIPSQSTNHQIVLVKIFEN